MGVFRVILALSVVLAHAGPVLGLRGLPGSLAVQAFFMVSGFYMALVLSTRYQGSGGYRLFLSNRFLRLFPTYWLIALLTLALTLAWSRWCTDCDGGDAARYFQYNFVGQLDALSAQAKAMVAFVNFSLLGQDTMLFLAQHPQSTGFVFTPDFRTEPSPGYLYLLVPQAWSLSLEIMFYLIAPALNRRSSCFLLGLVLASMLTRAFVYYVLGWHHDPWTYRFFPSELAFFVSGMLSYRWYASFSKNAWAQRWSMTTLMFLLLLTLAYPLLPDREALRWAYLAIVGVTLPFAFAATQKSASDRWIGELSYPIYICHFFALLLVSPAAAYWDVRGFQSAAVMLLSIALAAGINAILVEPIERLRAARYSRLAQHDCAGSAPPVEGVVKHLQ